MERGSRLIAVILASGRGTRLWPFAGEDTPKAFAEVNDGESLLCATARRLARIEAVESVITVCASGHEAKARQALGRAGVKDPTIITEKRPAGTATTLAYGALEALERARSGEVTIIGAMPVDHWIEDEGALASALAEAAEEARAGAICAIGVRPERAEPEYGYLRRGAPTGRTPSGAEIDIFVEHPTATHAHEMTLGGGWRWNSGIYTVGADAYLERLRECAPHAHDAVQRARVNGVRVNRTLHAAQPDLESEGELTVDAVLAGGGIETVAVELESRWRDIGAWRGVADTRPKDDEGNALEGQVLAYATRNSYIRATTRRVIAIGADDLLIVEGPHRVLIAKRGQEGALKGALRRIEKAQRTAP